MNKADLTRLGVIDERIQAQILKTHNEELNKFRKEARDLIPYREAVHAAHLGYNSEDVPTPESPEIAIRQLINEVRRMFEAEAQQVMSVYVLALNLLQQWQSINVLSNEARKELELTTATFLANHRDPSEVATQTEQKEV